MIPLRRIIVLGMLAAGTTAAAQTTDSLFVRVSGDSISIQDVRAVENCASLFTSALTISHNALTWVQTDTVGPIARCICHFDMEVSIAGLAPGSYLAWVYRDRRKVHHYSSDTMLFIGTIVFTVTTPAGTPEVRAFYQSDCHPTSVTEEAVTLVPAEMSLCNYPNPFNPVTTIEFRVAGGESRSGVGGGQTGSGMGGAGSSWVRLAVYDMLGREVGVLVNEWKRPGMYTVQFDGARLSSGVYCCRLQSEPSGEGVSGPFSEHGAQRILTTMMVLAK